jgi:hypothetical protein
MSINDCSTFDQPRPISSSVIESEQVTVRPCDFITFLAVAQRLQIQFLPITWQSTRQQIGIGGTSRIDEALMDLQTSFAFKRVAEEHKRDETEDSIFQVLISEITVLRHLTPIVVRDRGLITLYSLARGDQPNPVIFSVMHVRRFSRI